MPTIPVYRQQTTMEAAKYRPVDLPDRMSPALAKVGQGIADVGEVMGKLAIRRQQQTDALWLARSSAKADMAQAKALSDAVNLPLTDEEKDALRRGEGVLGARITELTKVIDEVENSAPSEDAMRAFKARRAETSADMQNRIIAHDASLRTSVLMADVEDTAGIYDEALGQVPDDLVDGYFWKAHDTVSQGIDALPGDPAKKEAFKAEKLRDLRHALARRIIERDNQEGTSELKTAIDSGDPRFAGMSHEEREVLEEEVARNDMHRMVEAKKQADAARDLRETEVIGQVYSGIIGGSYSTEAEIDTALLPIANAFGVTEAERLRGVWTTRNESVDNARLNEMQPRVDEAVNEGQSKASFEKWLRGSGVNAKEATLLRTRYEERINAKTKASFDAALDYIKAQIPDDVNTFGFDTGNKKASRGYAESVLTQKIEEAKANGQPLTPALYEKAAADAVKQVTGSPMPKAPEVLGVTLDSVEAIRKASGKIKTTFPQNSEEYTALANILRQALANINQQEQKAGDK